MYKHIKAALVFVCFLSTLALKAQKIPEIISPDYHWKSEYSTLLPAHAFDSTQTNTSDLWVIGGAWTKPHFKLAQNDLVTTPLWQTTNFNTVQGFETSLITDYKINSQWILRGKINYGFKEGVLRPQMSFWYRASTSHSLFFNFGQEIKQFNNSPAIVPRANTYASLLYENNVAKFYQSDFLKGSHFFKKNTKNGQIQIKNTLGLERNSPLKNRSDFVLFDNSKKNYTSNHPLFPKNKEQTSFLTYSQFTHDIYFQYAKRSKENKSTTQKYSSSHSSLLGLKTRLPFSVQNLQNRGENTQNYGRSTLAIAQHRQQLQIPNLGQFRSFVMLGTFLKTKEIPFVDFKHFNGNETLVVRGPYLEVFHLLPYYMLSTDSSFATLHLEHNFQGQLIKYIPILSEFNWELVVSYKRLAVSSKSPYQELGVGLGKIRLGKKSSLRIDYVQSYYDKTYSKGFVFGFFY